ncbi:hypothetical protein Sros_5496 [Streptosporangium roseum DSM 43021]|uniref:Uncharacterized protein n=1 Tax=Streptosporangium roseum (strain ATCC 12428 / DSM 43021 / JCM 3005 / KCTC 9067 / NCIMB 10171 / NRRL 2505 / NI 9100) TaxID=479432 RepID=D2BF94_STRRD|nr:hypothetical protein Sros_5496 [Streptosporangium roseum DSM 43021]
MIGEAGLTTVAGAAPGRQEDGGTAPRPGGGMIVCSADSGVMVCDV